MGTRYVRRREGAGMAVARFDFCAVVAERALAGPLARLWPGATAVALDATWGAIPLLRPLQLQLAGGRPLGLRRGTALPPALGDALASASLTAPVAYVEASFEGTLGAQAAVVWVAGEVALGPLTIDLERPTPGVRVPPVGDWPVNRALRHLGVRPTIGNDEWDTLRLGRLGRAKELEQLLDGERPRR